MAVAFVKNNPKSILEPSVRDFKNLRSVANFAFEIRDVNESKCRNE